MAVGYERLFWQVARQKRFCQVKTKMKGERVLWREPNRHGNGVGREEEALALLAAHHHCVKINGYYPDSANYSYGP